MNMTTWLWILIKIDDIHWIHIILSVVNINILGLILISFLVISILLHVELIMCCMNIFFILLFFRYIYFVILCMNISHLNGSI